MPEKVHNLDLNFQELSTSFAIRNDDEQVYSIRKSGQPVLVSVCVSVITTKSKCCVDFDEVNAIHECLLVFSKSPRKMVT